jgi:hypothetical protein
LQKKQTFFFIFFVRNGHAELAASQFASPENQTYVRRITGVVESHVECIFKVCL